MGKNYTPCTYCDYKPVCQFDTNTGNEFNKLYEKKDSDILELIKVKGKNQRMEWTREQKRIIDIRNSNILVSAAAGSGKTAVLVARIMDLIINDKENIDNF